MLGMNEGFDEDGEEGEDYGDREKGNDRGDDEGTTSSLGDSSSQELAIWFAMGCRCR